MLFRTATLLPTKTITTAGTETIDIDISDVISSIWLTPRLTNNGNTPYAHPAAAIKKIEVVDGSDVLLSLTGYEARALEYYITGKMPTDVLNWFNDNEIIAPVNLLFGRYLWDKNFAFDPKKFTNPQIKITHDRSLGGSTPDAATLAVYANIFDEKVVAPRGFMQSKEIYSFTPTASAKETIDLPRDLAYRLIMLQCIGGSGKQPSYVFDTVKLSEDFDHKVPIERSMYDYTMEIMKDYNMIVENHDAYGGAAGVKFYTAITLEGRGNVNPNGSVTDTCSLAGGDGGDFTAYCANSRMLWATVHGWCPHGAVPLILGELNDPTDWFDPKGLKSLRLIITAGSSPGTNPEQIVVQQQRLY